MSQSATRRAGAREHLIFSRRWGLLGEERLMFRQGGIQMRTQNRHLAWITLPTVALVVAAFVSIELAAALAARDGDAVPTFQYDPSWPKPLPNHWLMGQIAAMTIDSKEHIWIVQRPATLTSLGEMHGLNGEAECCFP